MQPAHASIAEQPRPVFGRDGIGIEFPLDRRGRRRRLPAIPSARATRNPERIMLSAMTETVTVAPLTISTGGRALRCWSQAGARRGPHSRG